MARISAFPTSICIGIGTNTIYIKYTIKYIWQNKKTRIKFAQITRKREHGGLATPDINRYYKAIVLSRMIEWTNGNSEIKWVEMENTISKITLHKNIWIPRKFRLMDPETHKITKCFSNLGHSTREE